MKKKNKLTIVLTAVLAIALAGTACEGPTGSTGLEGPRGPQGEQGPQGDEGNANVRTFDFTVTAAEWSGNTFYGSGNLYRTYNIPSEDVGGIDIASFFNSGGAIVVYVDAPYINNELFFSLPYTYQSPDDIGIKIVFLVSMGAVAITQTTSGWDNTVLEDDQLPEELNFRMVFIENASLNKMAKAGVDLSDYSSVKDYFGLPN